MKEIGNGFTFTERLVATGIVTVTTLVVLYSIGWLVTSYPGAFAAFLWVTLFTVLHAIDR